jgi:site-specific recombinase XerD
MQHFYSILFWLRKDVRSTKEEGYISVRITLNGKRTEISTGLKIETERWNSQAQQLKGNKEETRIMNNQLTTIRNKLNEIINELSKSMGKNLELEHIKNNFLGKIEKQKTLIEVFEYHNSKMKSQIGKDYSLGTYKRFETALKLLREFLNYQYHLSDISLLEVNHQFVTNLEYWFKTIRKCGHNTTMKYITNLRKIINLAISNEWTYKDPFTKFKFTLKEVKREALSEPELHTLSSKDFKTERLNRVRDIFIFCCYTGLAYADVEKLSYEQIKQGIDGQYWIFTERTKTKSASNIPLLPPALALIEKYKNYPTVIEKGHVFPVLTNQRMNAYLKEIADLCGFDKELTTHLARHTFATTITLTNGVPIETVSSMLGHKNIKTTQIYAKVVQTKVSKDMEKLRNMYATKAENIEEKETG